MENCHDFTQRNATQRNATQRNATQRNATQRNATPKPLLAIVFAAVSFCAAPSYAETNETLMPKGMWKDPATGLIWDQCNLGQTWNGETCTGEADEFPWHKAIEVPKQHNLGGYTDWQLPTIFHLQTIRKCSAGFSEDYPQKIEPPDPELGVVWLARCNKGSSQPTLDLQVFPRADARKETKYDLGLTMASSTPGKVLFWQSHAWYMNMTDGITIAEGGINSRHYVRLVRTNQAFEKSIFLKVLNEPFKAMREREEANRQRMAREQAAYDQRVAAFRRSVQVGDDTSQGVVIEIKGALIKIQTNESQCTQRDYKGDCANSMNTPVEKWVKRKEIYPQ